MANEPQTTTDARHQQSAAAESVQPTGGDILEILLRFSSLEKKPLFSPAAIVKAIEAIQLKHFLLSRSADSQADSPLIKAAKLCGASTDFRLLGTKTPLAYLDFTLSVPFITEGFAAFVLPRSSQSRRVATILGALARRVFRENGLFFDQASIPLVLIEYCPKGKYTYQLIADNGDDENQSLFDSFATAVCTNNEADFEIELEALRMRAASRGNREKIKERMKALGLKVLRGRKADVYLRRRSRKVSIDVAKLIEKYPEVYADCTRVRRGGEYITVKIHESATDAQSLEIKNP